MKKIIFASLFVLTSMQLSCSKSSGSSESDARSNGSSKSSSSSESYNRSKSYDSSESYTGSNPDYSESELSNFMLLYHISQKTNISQNDLKIALKLVKKIKYDGSPITVIGNTNYPSVTYVFGTIVRKNGSPLAISNYFDYLLLHSGSAEEELSFSFEEIFSAVPSTTLEILDSKNTNEQNYFIKQLAWGLVNDDGCSLTNYRKIFFSKKDLNKLYSTKYKALIDKILKEVEEFLKILKKME